MSMWTAASDELTDYLTKRDIEERRRLAESVLLDERRRRGQREDAAEDRQRQLFDQQTADRDKKLADEAKAKELEKTVNNLTAQRQASLNVAGNTVDLPTGMEGFGGGPGKMTVADPQGAQATRNALAVALRVAGAGDVADKGVAEDKASATAMGRQAAVTAYQQNPTREAALDLKLKYGIDVPKRQGFTEVSPGATLYDEETGTAKFTAPPLPQRNTGGGGDDDGEAELSGPALDMAALNYIRGGGIQAGYGKAGNRNRILIQNRAAELGPDANIAANKVEMAANRASLSKAQAMGDAINSFEGTITQNIGVFEEAAKKIADTGSPLLNKPLRYIQREVLGGTEQAAFDTARAVLVPELSRILMNPNLTGVLTDSARHEIDQIIAGNATIPQMTAMLKVLQRDMGNRKTEVGRTIGEINARNRAIGAPTAPAGGNQPPPMQPVPAHGPSTPAAPPAAPAGGGGGRYDPKTGTVVR
jgi:hypothetical protein